LKRNLQVFEESACIFYFTCKFLNSAPQFISSIDCTGIDLISKFPPAPNEKSRGSKSGEQQGQEIGPACYQSSVQDNFQAAIDTLHDYNAVEHRRVEAACDEARIKRSVIDKVT
jgi:hypothetical protein